MASAINILTSLEIEIFRNSLHHISSEENTFGSGLPFSQANKSHLVRNCLLSLGYPYQEWERQRKREEKREETERAHGEAEARKSAELKNTEKQKDRRINSKKGTDLPCPSVHTPLGQAADTLRSSCLFFFCSVLDKRLRREDMFTCACS